MLQRYATVLDFPNETKFLARMNTKEAIVIEEALLRMAQQSSIPEIKIYAERLASLFDDSKIDREGRAEVQLDD